MKSLCFVGGRSTPEPALPRLKRSAASRCSSKTQSALLPDMMLHVVIWRSLLAAPISMPALPANPPDPGELETEESIDPMISWMATLDFNTEVYSSAGKGAIDAAHAEAGARYLRHVQAQFGASGNHDTLLLHDDCNRENMELDYEAVVPA